MEYVSGGQLSDKLSYLKRLDELEAKKYFHQLIDAIGYCHRRGVFHRDLKVKILFVILPQEGSKSYPAGVTMAYVERGVVKDKRTIWRLSIISDFFRAIVNFIRIFFLTMFSIEKTDSYRKGYGAGKKWDGGPGGGGPGGGSGRGPGGGGGGGSRGPRTLTDLRSNDHSSLPACGSCCG